MTVLYTHLGMPTPPTGGPLSDIETAWLLSTGLIEGAHETPLWATFLGHLRAVTGADYATLIFHAPGRHFEDAFHLLSGTALPADVEKAQRAYFGTAKFPGLDLAEGRPYSLAELVAAGDGPQADFYRDLVSVHGINAARQVRVREPAGVDALLSLARRGCDFPVEVDSLLIALAPALRAVLRLYVERERERLSASLTAEAVQRLQFGWITMDAEGRVLDSDEHGGSILRRSHLLRQGRSGRLVARPAAIDREIQRALGDIAANPNARPRAITLSRDPWVDMLLLPARRRPMSATTAPVAVAYVHGDSWSLNNRSDQLAQLFGLSPREAELALALSCGMTLPEAAAQFGYKTDTARTYSKAIYAKTGARGMPDLVRIIMRSVLAVAW